MKKIVIMIMICIAISGIAESVDISTCTYLNTPGETYYLTADIKNFSSNSYCFAFGAANVTLDCQGHYIDGKPGCTNAIQPRGLNDIEIKNCVITDFPESIDFYWSSGTSYNVHIHDCSIDGGQIELWNANNLIFEDITITGSGTGLTVNSASANNNIIRRVNASGVTYGYYDMGSKNTNLSNCFFNGTGSTTGIHLSNTKDAIVHDIQVTGYGTSGIAFAGSAANNTVYNCFFNNSGTHGNVWNLSSFENFMNIAPQAGTRIYSVGAQIGGNFYANSSGGGYSETCTDADTDGFCDDIYNMTGPGILIDYYPYSTGGVLNDAPDLSDVSPVNNTYVAPVASITLGAIVTDADNDTMNASIRFYNTDAGSWQTYYFYDLATNDSIESTWTEQFISGTTYNWTVNVTDGTATTSETYSFIVPWLNCTMNESAPEIYCNLDGIPPVGTYGSTYIQYYDTVTFQSDNLIVSDTSVQTFGLDDYIDYGRSYLFRSNFWPDFWPVYGNNYTFTTHQCYENQTPEGCADGYICVNHTCHNVNDGCGNDTDCDSGEFCDYLYSPSFYLCDELKGQGETCWRNGECSSGDCEGDNINYAIVPPCEFGWFRKHDGYCHLPGICRADEYKCSIDTDCVDVNGSCYNTTGTGNQTCFCNNESGYCNRKYYLVDSYCQSDAWCLDMPYNTYQGENMSCLGTYCTPDSWECNVYSYGCAEGQYCNTTTGYDGDHACINCSLTNCSSDSECCTGNCVNGVCLDPGWECAGNPYVCSGGISSGDEDWRCPSGQWCHHDSILANWNPMQPNGLCYAFLSVGSQCNCAYQCESGLCAYSGSTKVCQNPGNESGNVTLNIDDWDEFTVGDFENIIAIYQESGIDISGASCTYTSNGITPNSGSLTQLPSTGAYYVSAEIANAPGSRSYTVTCSKSGYPTLSKTDYFTIYGTNETATDVNWHNYPTSADVGDSVTFIVDFETTAGSGIDDANCSLYLGVGSHVMTEQGGIIGRYYYTHVTSAQGAYSYHVTCEKSDYQTSSSYMHTLNVYESGGGPPIPPPESCSNGYEDGNESDVDCGGVCDPCTDGKDCFFDDDCVSDWCYNGVCTSPSCSDGIMNGEETGVDCGGYCPPCGCFHNWDCASDGSEHCSSGYQCITDTCPPNCTALYWYDINHGYYYRGRECYNGLCRFSTENESIGEVSMRIIPETEFIWNDSGRILYVSNCEDGTHKFTVLTDIATQKRYYHSNPLYYSPYVAPTNNLVFGNMNYETETAALIGKLCEISSGSDMIYSLITFHAMDESSQYDQQSVYTLTFRKSFTFDAEIYDDDVILINLTRNGTCYYQNSSYDSWIGINSMPAIEILWNISTNPSYNLKCNNTYGESATGAYAGGTRGIFLFFFWIIWLIFGAIWEAIFGSEFVWHSWYILPLVVLILFVFPTLVIMLLYAKRLGKRGEENE